MRHRPIALLLLALLVACGFDDTPPPLPTARIARRAQGALAVSPAPSLTVDPTTLPSPTPAPPSAAPTASPATTEEQYRAWMEEARSLYPYDEPLETMWALMICESSGNAEVVAGAYQGLFQYDSATWAGDWNPYHDSPILDPRAQIFATAKAWHDGKQAWWGCYQ